MRTFPSAALALSLTLLLAIPALAQAETVTVTFELTVRGAPLEGMTFFVGGRGRDESGEPVPLRRQLTDPDGDGVYTGTLELPRGEPFRPNIFQGFGVTSDGQNPDGVLLGIYGGRQGPPLANERDTTFATSVEYDGLGNVVPSSIRGRADVRPTPHTADAGGSPVGMAGVLSVLVLGAFGVLRRT
jgi:hypothetical protein